MGSASRAAGRSAYPRQSPGASGLESSSGTKSTHCSRFPPAVGQNSIARLDEELARSDVGAMSLLPPLLGALRAAVRTHRNLALENLALRQQLALLRGRSTRPRFGSLDRAFWVWLSRRWAGWREALHIVRPETVIRWHRKGFRSFWTWKSRRARTGRPRIGSELAELVRTMALANPLWGAPRIHGELLKLRVSQRTVARLMPRRPKPVPRQNSSERERLTFLPVAWTLEPS